MFSFLIMRNGTTAQAQSEIRFTALKGQLRRGIRVYDLQLPSEVSHCAPGGVQMIQNVMRHMREMAISESIKPHSAMMYRRSVQIRIVASAIEAFARLTDTA